MYVACVSSTFTSYDKRRVRLFRIRDWILRYRSTTGSANDSAFLCTGSKGLQVFQIHHYVYHKAIGEERKLGVDVELSAGTRTIIFPCWWKGARAESVWRTVTKSLNHNKPGCRSAFARDLSVRLLIVIVEFSRNLPRLEFPARFARSFHKYQPRAAPIRAQFASKRTYRYLRDRQRCTPLFFRCQPLRDLSQSEADWLRFTISTVFSRSNSWENESEESDRKINPQTPVIGCKAID